MAKKPRLTVVDESNTGLNRRFKDNVTGEILNRGDVNKRIKSGDYEDYHIMHINNKNVPRSNPNSSSDDNLG